MKEVHPSEIKIGDYYIQEMNISTGNFVLLKRRIKGENEKLSEIWGEYIKIINQDVPGCFEVGEIGVQTEIDGVKWYLLSEGEALLYMI